MFVVDSKWSMGGNYTCFLGSKKRIQLKSTWTLAGAYNHEIEPWVGFVTNTGKSHVGILISSDSTFLGH